MSGALLFPRRPALLRWMISICAAAGVVLAVGFWIDPERVWLGFLMGSFALLCLGLAGLFFVALQYVSGAVWSIPLRRVGEAMAAALPGGAAGMLAVIVVHPRVYPWYSHLAVSANGWPGFKQTWLSYPFFLVRTVLYLAIWLWFGWAMRKNSRRQDQVGGGALSRKNTRLAAAFMVAFGVSFWLASTDWIMSLEPEWASTIFGIYHFSGMFLAGLAAISLLTLALRRTGALRGYANDSQLLDLGRLMVAFSTFWAYIWFSQYMLIWYANLAEETPYMSARTGPVWGRLFVVNVLLNWALPFLLLLPRRNKTNPRTLALASVAFLLGRCTDLYLMIIPPSSKNSAWPAIWDLAVLVLVSGSFVFLVFREFSRAAPVPIGDPLLPENLFSHYSV